MKSICIIGCGYVGLVSGAGLADFNNRVTCCDIDERRIKKLNELEIPIYEPGLEELIDKNRKAGRVSFTKDISSAVRGCDAVFLAVQTPQDKDGNANLEYLFKAAEDIANKIETPAVIVIKSTVPVGTSKKVTELMENILKKRGLGFSVDVVSNPEFLIEGKAVETFMNPDRIVIGYKNNSSAIMMKEIYERPISEGKKIILCSNETAETIKYAANSFLAMKISFINQMALFCSETGADIDAVARALGSDSRINPKFLNPGPGYGGSCFPKDTKALVRTAEVYGIDLSIIREADDANEKHKLILAEKVVSVMKESGAEKLAVWGLAFKAGTDDVRNTPAKTILPVIKQNGIGITAYDPKAGKEARQWIQSTGLDIDISEDMYECAKGADALLVLTEWPCFAKSSLEELKMTMKGNTIFDYRNIFSHDSVKKHGFRYYSVGRRYEAD